MAHGAAADQPRRVLRADRGRHGLDPGVRAAAVIADGRVLWVNPDTGIRVNLDQWVDEAVDYNDEGNTTTVRSRMAAETDDLTDYIGGAWINSI